MPQESAVQFATASRVHTGLAVRDLALSVAFYRTFFGQEPTKIRHGYAKFEVAEPPFNLALNGFGGPTGPNNPDSHFGIQVKSTDEVRRFAERLRQAGLPVKVEEQVTCCYAVQNKVWTADPDGNKWEVYVVLDDRAAQHPSSQGECCPAAAAANASQDAMTPRSAAEPSHGTTACCCPAR